MNRAMCCGLVVAAGFALSSPLLGAPLTPGIVDPENGHTYYMLPNSDWTDAEAMAVAMGGNLATIRNQSEQDFLWTTFGNYEGRQRNLWIGLNDLAQTGDFQWVSGEPVTVTYWEPANPDNIGSEHYVHLAYYQGLPGYPGDWNNNIDRLDQVWAGQDVLFYGIAEVTPEPTSLSLLLGLVAVATFARRKRRARNIA